MFSSSLVSPCLVSVVEEADILCCLIAPWSSQSVSVSFRLDRSERERKLTLDILFACCRVNRNVTQLEYGGSPRLVFTVSFLVWLLWMIGSFSLYFQAANKNLLSSLEFSWTFGTSEYQIFSSSSAVTNPNEEHQRWPSFLKFEKLSRHWVKCRFPFLRSLFSRLTVALYPAVNLIPVSSWSSPPLRRNSTDFEHSSLENDRFTQFWKLSGTTLRELL